MRKSNSVLAALLVVTQIFSPVAFAAQTSTVAGTQNTTTPQGTTVAQNNAAQSTAQNLVNNQNVVNSIAGVPPTNVSETYGLKIEHNSGSIKLTKTNPSVPAYQDTYTYDIANDKMIFVGTSTGGSTKEASRAAQPGEYLMYMDQLLAALEDQALKLPTDANVAASLATVKAAEPKTDLVSMTFNISTTTLAINETITIETNVNLMRLTTSNTNGYNVALVWNKDTKLVQRVNYAAISSTTGQPVYLYDPPLVINNPYTPGTTMWQIYQDQQTALQTPPSDPNQSSYFIFINEITAGAVKMLGAQTDAAKKQSIQNALDRIAINARFIGNDQNNIVRSADGNELTFKMGNQKYTFNKTTKLIVNNSVNPAATYDALNNPLEYRQSLAQLMDFTSNMILQTTGRADKRNLQVYFDTLVVTNAATANVVTIEKSGNKTMATSTNVRQIWINGALQYSFNNTTKAITYVNAQGQQTTITLPSPVFSDPSYYLIAEKAMDAALDFSGGYTGAGMSMFVAIGNGMGMQTTLPRVASSTITGDSRYLYVVRFGNVANANDNKIVVYTSTGKYYLDTTARKVYQGTFGTGGFDQTDSNQNAQYKAMVQQMLTRVTADRGNPMLSPADTGKFDSIIVMLNDAMKDPFSAGVSTNKISASYDGRTINFFSTAPYLAFNFSFNLDTKQLTDISKNPPVILDSYKNPGDWIRAMNLMYTQATSIKNAQTSAAVQQTIQGYMTTMDQTMQNAGIQVKYSGNLVFNKDKTVVEAGAGAYLLDITGTTKTITMLNNPSGTKTSYNINGTNAMTAFLAGQMMFHTVFPTGNNVDKIEMMTIINTAFGGVMEPGNTGVVTYGSFVVLTNLSTVPSNPSQAAYVILDKQNHVVYTVPFSLASPMVSRATQYDQYRIELQKMLTTTKLNPVVSPGLTDTLAHELASNETTDAAGRKVRTDWDPNEGYLYVTAVTTYYAGTNVIYEKKSFTSNSTNISQIETFSSTGQKASLIVNNPAGKMTAKTLYDYMGVPASYTVYDPASGNVSQENLYGAYFDTMTVFSLVTKFKVSETVTQKSNNRITSQKLFDAQGHYSTRVEYDQATGNKSKEIVVDFPSERDKSVTVFSPSNGQKISLTVFDLAKPGSVVQQVTSWANNLWVSDKFYDTATLKMITEKGANDGFGYAYEKTFDASTGTMRSYQRSIGPSLYDKTTYTASGVKDSVTKYDGATGRRSKLTMLTPTGAATQEDEFDITRASNLRVTCTLYTNGTKTQVNEYDVTQASNLMTAYAIYKSNGVIDTRTRVDALGRKTCFETFDAQGRRDKFFYYNPATGAETGWIKFKNNGEELNRSGVIPANPY